MLVTTLQSYFYLSQGTLDRPMLQPRVVEFSKVTAKFFLQQTKPLWLNLEMSRQDGKSYVIDYMYIIKYS